MSRFINIKACIIVKGFLQQEGLSYFETCNLIFINSTKPSIGLNKPFEHETSSHFTITWFQFSKITTTHTTFVLVYVDDITITSSSSQVINQLINSLNVVFLLKDLGPLHYFDDISCQTKCILDLLFKANMSLIKPITTFMTIVLKFSIDGDEDFDDPFQYHSILCHKQSLLVHALFQSLSLDSHQAHLRYLVGTTTHGLTSSPFSHFNLTVFCEIGVLRLMIGNLLLIYSLKKQHIVSHSSIEVEYQSIVATIIKLMLIKSLLQEPNVESKTPPTIYYDNSGAVSILDNLILHS
ncbi:putative mitochondrial protein, partial [Mucuna pruriens]